MNDTDLTTGTELTLLKNDESIIVNKKRDYFFKILKNLVALFILIFIACAIYFSFVATNFAKYIVSDSSLTKDQELARLESIRTASAISDEAIVLLENKENFLPLSLNNPNYSDMTQPFMLNLFGINSQDLALSEGDHTTKKVLSLETALTNPKLTNGGFLLNEELQSLYYNYYTTGTISLDKYDRKEKPIEYFEKEKPLILEQPPIEVFKDSSLFLSDETIVDRAKEFSSTALVVIGRHTKDNTDSTISSLKLTESEEALLDMVTENFPDVVLLLNTNAPFNLDFLDNYPSIKAVLYTGYLGETGSTSIAKILDGTVTPSGRLADIWLYDNLYNPATNNFLEQDEIGNWIEESGSTGNLTRKNKLLSKIINKEDKSSPIGYFLNYAENIYVGYRYFETAYSTDKDFDYNNIVKYPFGYGLSYTSFSQEIKTYTKTNGNFTIDIEVTNTGNYRGSEVVQIYYEPPYNGNIEKSTRNLLEFKKTKILEPSEKTVVTLTFNLEDLVAFDSVNNMSYVLEKGDYVISHNNNSHNKISNIATITIKDDIIFNDDNYKNRISDNDIAISTFPDMYYFNNNLTQDFDKSSYAFSGTPSLNTKSKEENQKDINVQKLPLSYNLVYEKPIMLKDLKGIDYDSELWDAYISQLSLKELATLVSDGAWHISSNKSLGIPNAYFIDATKGLKTDFFSGSLLGKKVTGVLYPSNSSLATTWNKDLAYEYGKAISNEAKSYGITGIYTSGLSIHRTAYDGNYSLNYSEDPLLSGKIGANFIKATSDNEVLAISKNFILSERQSKSKDELQVFTTEQALREIYLKPFELIVKEGDAKGIMTSYNFLGELWTGANSNLLIDVLQNEWGYKGIVTTDIALYTYMDPIESFENGTNLYFDVYQIFFKNHSTSKVLYDYITKDPYKSENIYTLQQSAKNILYTITTTYIVE